ncbi:MAG: hypothetical protein P0Y53_05430 [Candidatus Pseudobacter hemicellulosilyticus]|uniref:Uncharacterized protein n=1 Tax=Candidatus Pseudobacter hemicellulosilyticus TaxID=3121375 RepID=A0AAJ6BI57_9BACT|nr:MAG: hypothetical protein P0Y53_05430 [Pseudobacter sp.]
MKKNLLLSLGALLALFVASTAGAQDLAPNQNPQYMFSQQKYIRMMDSINTWHGTTPQETYKAIDFLADKREARELRKASRRELRLERARYGGWNNNDYYNNSGFYGYYGGYRRPWNNYGWNNAIPFAAGIGLGSWWWR